MSKFMDEYRKLINCKIDKHGHVHAYDYQDNLINLNDINNDKEGK